MPKMRDQENTVMKKENIIILTFLFLLTACSAQTSHIPNPILLPAYGVQSIFSNGAYNHRRAKVTAFIEQNFNTLDKAVLKNNTAEVLTHFFKIARITPEKQTPLLNELKERHKFYFRSNEDQAVLIERITVTTMVHSD